MSNEEALKVLAEVRAKIGRKYKSAIRNAWITGRYYENDLQQWDCRLQIIRNSFGPSWLINARP